MRIVSLAFIFNLRLPTFSNSYEKEKPKNNRHFLKLSIINKWNSCEEEEMADLSAQNYLENSATCTHLQQCPEEEVSILISVW